MARRTKDDAAETREHLLDAAQRVFRERGVTRTTLAEVATAAGVTRGAVYWHFKDKAALFTAMCERATLPLDTMLAAARSAPGNDPLGTLRSLMVDALQHLARDPRTQAVFEVLFDKTEMAGALGEVAGRRDKERCDCLDVQQKLVSEAIACGALPPDTDPLVTTQLLNAFVSGLMREWVLQPAAFDLARSAPGLVDCVLAGIVARPPLLARKTAAEPAAATA
jgi:TetR/AcrR family acrAB operon transcriptional repressor